MSPLVGPGVLAAVARRPDLWPTAVALGWRTARPGWWRHWPPAPTPPEGYADFRARTMYGPRGGALDPAAAVGYLEWCRRQGRRHG